MRFSTRSPSARPPTGALLARPLHAFFFAAGRPAVVVGIGSCLLVSGGLITAMTRGDLGVHADAGFLYAFLLPGLAGILAAQVIMELQHCSFTWPLPGVRWKTALGFVVAGAAVTLVVVGLSWQRAEAGPAVLLAVGLTAFCLGSLLNDPLSATVSAVCAAIGLAILVFSATAAQLAAGHPAVTLALVAPATTGLCLWRLFGRHTFRLKPFKPTKAMITSPDQAQRYEREKRMASKPTGRPWRAGYLGTDTWKWTRASFYEHWGDLGWADVLRAQRFWPAVLLVLGLDAVIDRGGRGYLEALANVFYHAFYLPPDQPSFGDKPDPHLMVLLVISMMGAYLAFLKPAAVEATWPYPLSRADRSRIAFSGNLVTSALFLLVVGSGAFLIAQAAGWAAGLPLRLDFVPHFLRALLATLIVMPAVFWIRLRTRSFQDRPPGERGIVTLVWMVALWLWVCLWCFVIGPLSSPAVELAVTAVLILMSYAIYRSSLEHHFATADLV